MGILKDTSNFPAYFGAVDNTANPLYTGADAFIAGGNQDIYINQLYKKCNWLIGIYSVEDPSGGSIGTTASGEATGGVSGGIENLTTGFNLLSVMGWKSMSGLKFTVEKNDYRESGDENVNKQVAGNTTYPPLVLSKGTGDAKFLYAWARASSKLRGEPTINVGETYAYKHLLVVLRDNNLKPARFFFIRNGWVSDWGFDDFDSVSSEISQESIEVTHSGIEELVYSAGAISTQTAISEFFNLANYNRLDIKKTLTESTIGDSNIGSALTI